MGIRKGFYFYFYMDNLQPESTVQISKYNISALVVMDCLKLVAHHVIKV